MTEREPRAHACSSIRPDRVRESNFHCRGYAERLLYSAEVVLHEVKRNLSQRAANSFDGYLTEQATRCGREPRATGGFAL
jgi:hypothetical protein